MHRIRTEFELLRGTLTDWLKASDGRWMLVLIVAAIVLSGPMVAGYAVLDEIAVYMLLAVVLMLAPAGTRRPSLTDTRLQYLHRGIFIAFSAYLAVQALRGMVVLGDVRMLRFVALFIALITIALNVRSSYATVVNRPRIARMIVWATSIYLLLYLTAGMVTEWHPAMTRFDLQGYWWSGTSAALLPVPVSLPSLLVVGSLSHKPNQRLFWIGLVLMLLAGFYYESRLVWLSLIVFLVAGGATLGLRRSALAVCLYLLLVTFYPFIEKQSPTPQRVTPQRILSYVTETIYGIPNGRPIANMREFLTNIFPGLVSAPAAVLAQYRGEGGEQTAGSEQKEPGTSAKDLDRKIAITAALRQVTADGWATLLFGTGYYTHRYALLPAIQEIAKENKYQFPETYNTIVRTATANAMIVDTGLVGILLFLALFIFAALTILGSLHGGDRGRPALVLVGLGALALIGLCLFIAAISDAVLLYFALMPHGAILALYPANSKRSHCKQSQEASSEVALPRV